MQAEHTISVHIQNNWFKMEGKGQMIKTDTSGKWVATEFVLSLMESLKALEQQLDDAKRRIAELESKNE